MENLFNRRHKQLTFVKGSGLSAIQETEGASSHRSQHSEDRQGWVREGNSKKNWSTKVKVNMVNWQSNKIGQQQLVV